jgi:lipopolysaccharide transport system ATP-binding protein
MNNIALKIENLIKEYRLGTIGYGTLREDLQSWWARVRGKDDPNSLITDNHTKKSEREHFLALNDISFEIKKGDRVGLIGRNGAGKSTLLKILSRITTPTAGKIYIDGKIGSLLEVGTGFHGELTGRENIFLNGAILGMSKKEIRSKLDEIVAFSGVEKFIDTPVKRYSSGMFVRLGFAVAAHLEPDILIVDEVLAVGDLEFQKRAIGKMKSVSTEEGRTILFVSHNISTVRRLCTHGLLLDQGKLIKIGEIEAVASEYEGTKSTGQVFKPIEIDELGLKIKKISINNGLKMEIAPLKPLKVEIEFQADKNVKDIGLWIMIRNHLHDNFSFMTNPYLHKKIKVELPKGESKAVLTIPELPFSSGHYILGFGIDEPFKRYYYYEKDLLRFNVKETSHPISQLPANPNYGLFYLDHTWEIE